MTTFPLLMYRCRLRLNPLVRHLSALGPVQEAELMIGHLRDLDLWISRLVVQNYFAADMNGFSLKMIFATAEDTDIIIFSGTTAWIVDINKLK